MAWNRSKSHWDTEETSQGNINMSFWFLSSQEPFSQLLSVSKK